MVNIKRSSYIVSKKIRRIVLDILQTTYLCFEITINQFVTPWFVKTHSFPTYGMPMYIQKRENFFFPRNFATKDIIHAVPGSAFCRSKICLSVAGLDTIVVVDNTGQRIQ